MPVKQIFHFSVTDDSSSPAAQKLQVLHPYCHRHSPDRVFASLWKFTSHASTLCIALNKFISQVPTEQPNSPLSSKHSVAFPAQSFKVCLKPSPRRTRSALSLQYLTSRTTSCSPLLLWWTPGPNAIWGGKGLLWLPRPPWKEVGEGTQIRNPKSGTETGATEKHFLLTYSPWLVQFAFLYNIGIPT